MIGRITRSLSARLLAIFVVTAFVYGIASRYMVDLVWGTGYLSEVVGAHMTLHVDYVLNDIGLPPSIERAQAIVERVPVDLEIEGPGLKWASNPKFPPLDQIPFARSEFLEPYGASAPDAPRWKKTVGLMEFARYKRRAFVKIKDGPYQIVFVSPRLSEVPHPDLTTPAIGLLAIFVLAGCYALVRWLVQPVQWIKAGARRIGQGDLDHRIPASRKDDLGELAADINKMADDVKEMLEAKRQLLLAISHELRSPLTRLKVSLEFLEDPAVRDGLMQDIREMERLIADLLESERLNTRHSPLQVTRIDLGELAGGVVSADLAAQTERITFKPPAQPIVLAGDAMRLRLLIKNLLENALRYSPADCKPVELSVAVTGGTAEIRIRDHGRGMSPHDLSRATEPFYRADPARSRATGGLGLGLYLCRRIAEAHGGSLRISSELGFGTQVIVQLPLDQPVASAKRA